MCSAQSTFFYGVFVKTAYLCFASDAYKNIKGSLLGIDLICSRRRKGTLSTTDGHESVKSVPDEVWKMIKPHIGRLAVLEAEKNEVLAHAADYSDDELEDDENAGKWENGMMNEWQQEEFYESGGMHEMIRERSNVSYHFFSIDKIVQLTASQTLHLQGIKVLLEAFGLISPSDELYSKEESSSFDRDCLSAISLPLQSTASPSTTETFPSTSLDANSDYGSVQQAVKFSKQAFAISPSADHRFKSFLFMFRLQAVSNKMETIYSPQHVETELATSEASKSKPGKKKKESEAKRKAAHKAVCCNEPDAEPHWHMWTVSHCY